MSQKLDAQGNIVGPYGRDDLQTFWSPEKKVKDRRRKKLRDLHYDLIWEITEMQVKVYVQATFPNQVGSPLSQLAKEQALGPDEKTITGESRSKALDKDIEITNCAAEEHGHDDDDEEASEDERRDIPRKICAPVGSQLINGHPRQHQQPGAEPSSLNSGAHQQRSLGGESHVATGQEGQAKAHQTIPNEAQEPVQTRLDSGSSGILRQSEISQGLSQDTTETLAGSSSSNNSRTDGRRRDGK